jgi:hypothetical protein
MSWLIVGAIPAAYIAGRLVKGKDIRGMGDSNVGARNAFVELGHKTGIGVFAFGPWAYPRQGSFSTACPQLSAITGQCISASGEGVEKQPPSAY